MKSGRRVRHPFEGRPKKGSYRVIAVHRPNRSGYIEVGVGKFKRTYFVDPYSGQWWTPEKFEARFGKQRRAA